MTLVTTRELLQQAHERGSAVGAFNVIVLEHAEAIAAAAASTGRPAIMQFSQNCAAYHGGDLAPLMAAAAQLAHASAGELSLHLDHVEDLALLKSAATLGASSVMYDASKMAYADNVTATAEVRRWTSEHDLLLEAELGEVGGKGGPHDPGVRTSPAEAAAFVEATRVDALAVAVGSSHAMRTRTATLDHDLISELARAVPVPLVLHGSSGVDDAGLRAAVDAGMTKINVGTALNQALTAAVRTRLSQDGSVVDPRDYLGAGRSAMHDATAQLLRVISD